MSFTDMLIERIDTAIPILLIIAGLVFIYLAHTPMLSVIEGIAVGSGIFIALDAMRFDSYAFGDILTAGAIGAFVGIENIAIIAVIAIVLSMLANLIAGALSRSKSFNMAFVPFLFMATVIILRVRGFI